MNKSPKDKTTLTAREVAVLIEDLRSQFRVFGEGLSTLKSKVDAIFEEQGRQKEELFIVKGKVNAIKGEIFEIKSDIKIIKKDVAEIKVTFNDHEKRMTHLETSK